MLANIVLLAHAVIPHHHHKGMVVSIGNWLSPNDALEHGHDCGLFHSFHCSHDADHHDHGEGVNEDCILNGLYARLDQDRQQHLLCDKEDFLKHIDCSCHFELVPADEIETKDYGNLPFRQKPYIPSSYSHYITHSLGLRAPPSY